uniref:TSA: Wollemia nobilis Ref_Wollemi_Transcript_12104_1592 transcribed RNA sequence n=1 Tax=Wollemia nobilis TaxID=56998 RepID=A0A0C9S886_9CONI
MAFWDLLTVASMPVVRVLLISFLGAFLSTQYMNVLTKDARKHLNKVVFIVFTPALMFASLAESVTFEDLISWWYMPFNIFLTVLFGASLGWIIVKITKPPEHLNGIIVANCCAGNLGNLLLIVIPAICHEKRSPFGEPSVCKVNATSYASFSMALGSIFIWSYAYSLVKSSSQIYEEEELESRQEEKIPNIDYLDGGQKANLLRSVVIVPKVRSCGQLTHSQSACSMTRVSSLPKDFSQEVVVSPAEKPSCFRNCLGNIEEHVKEVGHLLLDELKAPPTLGVIAGFIVGAIPQAKALIVGESSPLRVIQDSISLLGEGTIPSIILVMGGNLIEGLKSSGLRPVIIVSVICVRFVLLPVIGIFVVKGASYLGMLPADPLYHFVMMIQFTVPPAMNIATMAQLFNVGEQECAVIFLWTYVLAAFALTFWSTVYLWILFPTLL